MVYEVDDCGSWGIVYCNVPADMATILALPGSWPMGAQPTAFVRNDQQKNLPTGFDPLSIAWNHVFWAEDPGWTPKPVDGANVTSWRNAAAPSFPLVSAGPPHPVFQAANANLGGRPSIKIGYGSAGMHTSGAATTAQPSTVVAVFFLDTGTNDRCLFDGFVLGNRWFWRMREANTHQAVYAGGADVQFGSALPTAAAYFACITFNGAATAGFINGNAPITAPSSPGTVALGDVAISTQDASAASQTAGGMDGNMAFLGFKGGGGLTPTDITNLQSWAKTHYNLPY